MAKKILVLTLGTGDAVYRDISGDIVNQMYKNATFFSSYKSTDYRFSDGITFEHSEFVAKPLIEHEKPDIVFLIGTIKSVWTALYSRFVVDDRIRSEENMHKLYEIERSARTDSSDHEIFEAQRIIQEIYDTDGLLNGLRDQDTRVYVILTKYGLNDEELRFNYEQIKMIKNVLVESDYAKERIEVSFDITHSFRSLPLYNLVVLDLIKKLTDIDLTISHVFYGNLDVTGDLHYTPIIDLHEVTDVMTMSNAISEFKNGGNAGALIRLVPDEEIRRDLLDFDWSLQLNRITETGDSMHRLLLHIEEVLSRTVGKEKDLYQMLSDVCDEFFPSKDDFDRMGEPAVYPYAIGYVQSIIGRWLIRIGRCGQAAVVAQEAWRSYIMPIMLHSKGIPATVKAVQDFSYRQSVSTFQDKVCTAMKDTELEPIVHGFRKLSKDLADIRNGFSHMILTKDSSNLYCASDAKELIEETYCYLDQWGEAMRTNWDKIKESIDNYNREKRNGASPKGEKHKEKESVYIFTPEKGKGRSLVGTIIGKKGYLAYSEIGADYSPRWYDDYIGKQFSVCIKGKNDDNYILKVVKNK